MTVFHPFKSILVVIIFFLFGLLTAHSVEMPLLIVKENTPDSKLIINWKNESGIVSEGVWIKSAGDLWYRKSNQGCGLPMLCKHDSIMINQYANHDCIYAFNGVNVIQSARASQSYRTKKDAKCDIFEKPYRVRDVTQHFSFSQNTVKLNSREYKRSKNPRRSDLDVSADGKKVVTTLYQYVSTSLNNTVIYFDLKNKIAKEILFPRQGVLAGFIDENNFVVKLLSESGMTVSSASSDANFGVLYRFDWKFNGKYVEVKNSTDRGVCMGSLNKFDVNSVGITLSGSSPGVCGHIDFKVVGQWQKDNSLLPVLVEGLGNGGGQVNTLSNEVALINYAARECGYNYGSVCNSNDNFFYAEFDKKGITVKPILSVGNVGQKDIALHKEIPERGYLYPVWKKRYDGLADISAKLHATADDKYLHIKLDVRDDNVVDKNHDGLKNDHVEFWLYTNPSIFPQNSKIQSPNYRTSWISKSHYLVGKDKVTLLDIEQYKKAGLDKNLFKNFTSKIKVKHNKTKSGYYREISLPLKNLPFYQMEDKRQCFNIMVDVVDVDKSNQQEALVSSNIRRKWGSLVGAAEFCFNHDKDLSDAYFMNQQGLTMTKPENKMALVLFDGKNYKPVQFNDTSKKVKEFSKQAAINYKKSTIIELPKSELDKIVHTGMDNSCDIEKAYYVKEYNKLLLLTDCPGSESTSHLSVIDAGKKPIFRIEHQNYYTGCYRHCNDGDYVKDISDLEYGVLNDSIHVVHLNKSAFYFTSDNKWGSVSASGGLPKTADLIIADIPKMRERRESWRDNLILQFKQPLKLKGKQLNFFSKVYRSSMAEYVSYNPNDISCLEKSMFQNYIATGKLEQFAFFPKECASAFFNKQKIKRPIKVLYQSKPKENKGFISLKVNAELSQRDLDKELTNPTTKKLSLTFDYRKINHNLNIFRNINSPLEELRIVVHKPKHIHLLSPIKYLKNLKTLHIEVPTMQGLNQYLLMFKRLDIKSFSLKTRACNEGESIRIPFGSSIEALILETHCQISAGDLYFPKAKYVNIQLASIPFKGKDLTKIFPNVERIKIWNIVGAFSKVPATLKIVEGYVASKHSNRKNLSKALSIYSGINKLTIKGQQAGIIPHLQNLPIPELYISGGRRLLPFSGVKKALQKYFGKETTDQVLLNLLSTCNSISTPKVNKTNSSSLKLALSPRCASKALWMLDYEGKGFH